MKYYFLTLILATVAVAGMSCEQAKSVQEEKTNQKPAADPVTAAAPEAVTDNEPLLLDDEPLLLDDGTGEGTYSGSMTDNNRCFVCHINYMEEDIAVIHARVNMGCANCHGESDEHIADESWASGGNGTPPEIMYPRDKINPFCLNCHPKDEIGTSKHKRFFAGTAEEKCCTDCHGDHRLAERKCKWK
jgi:hypothetical protein